MKVVALRLSPLPIERLPENSRSLRKLSVELILRAFRSGVVKLSACYSWHKPVGKTLRTSLSRFLFP
jgi:hypothetical protein